MGLEKEDDIIHAIERLREALESGDEDWLQQLIILRELSPSEYEKVDTVVRAAVKTAILAPSPSHYDEAIGTWSSEKEELLKTHPSWFVAYQDGKRVALEPSLDRLVAALDEKLGTPRKPCELHEIVERPPIRRGPSPRLRPVRTGRQENSQWQKSS